MRNAILAALLGMSACAMGCDGGHVEAGADAPPVPHVFDDHAAGDAGEAAPPRVCPKYPVPFDTDGREDQALAALQELAPNATLDWSAPRGTPARIDNFDLALECAPGRDVFGAAVELFSSRPTLFHLDADEWTPTAWLPCESVGDKPAFLVLARERIAGMPAERDLLTFIVKRIGSTVMLRTVVGVYLGDLQPHTKSIMHSCHSMADVEGAVREQRYEFETFAQCRNLGLTTYQPQPGDLVTEAAEPSWRWFANGDVVSLRATRWARVEVASENITDELLASTATCPSPEGPPSVGFHVEVDDVTGEVLSVQAGLGCIVCAN